MSMQGQKASEKMMVLPSSKILERQVLTVEDLSHSQCRLPLQRFNSYAVHQLICRRDCRCCNSFKKARQRNFQKIKFLFKSKSVKQQKKIKQRAVATINSAHCNRVWSCKSEQKKKLKARIVKGWNLYRKDRINNVVQVRNPLQFCMSEKNLEKELAVKLNKVDR